MEIHSYESESVWYAPDYKDNRELPEADQFRVRLVPIPKPDYQKLEAAHTTLKKISKRQVLLRFNRMKESIVAKCILEVENFHHRIYKEDGSSEVVPITTGQELVTHSPEEIVDGILSALKDQSLIEEGLRGKSDLPSVSSL